MKQLILIVILMGGFTFICGAQTTGQNVGNWPTGSATSFISGSQPGVHEFGFWGGYSFGSNDGVWGKTGGAELSILGMRYNRKLVNFTNSMLLEYSLKINLLAWYRYPDDLIDNKTVSTYGFGLTPFGLQLNWRKNDQVQPFFASAAGIMYLNNPFPDGRGTRVNFTLELGGGFEIMLSRHSSFSVGYRYHHMSNGSTGEVNPGVDSNVIYGTFTFF